MNTVCYDSPATDMETFVVGNGRLSAFVCGGIEHETIKIKEESVWNASYKDRNNTSCAENLSRIHSLFSQSKEKEASALVAEAMSGVPSYNSCMKDTCSLSLDFYSSVERTPFENISVYKRSLDLDTAVATSSFASESSTPSTAIFSRNTSGSSIMYSREVIASAPSDVIAFHISASIPKSIYFRARFDSDVDISRQYSLGDDVIAIEKYNGIPFCAMAMVVASGGKVFIRGGYIVVEGADDATIYIDVETAFRNRRYLRKGGAVVSAPSRIASWCSDKALRKLCFAAHLPYQDFRAEHIMEYSSLYKRTALSICPKDSATDFARDWNYEKYRLLSFSRAPGTLPVLLEGNYSVRDYLPLNYESVCSCGLSNTLLPVINLLSRAYKKGKKTAAVMYNCGGYVIHNSLDLWGDSVSSGCDKKDFCYIMGSSILPVFVREYYEYTLDKRFLRKHFYLLKDACEFYADFLELHPNSPFVDIKLLSKLLDATVKSAKDLCLNDTKSDILRLKELLSKIKSESSSEDSSLVQKSRLLSDTYKKIVCSELRNDSVGHFVEISLLPCIEELNCDGKLTGAYIKGNLKMDIEWKDNIIISAKVYSASDMDFIHNLVIKYKNKEYTAEIVNKEINLKNVLPSTI